MTVQESTIRVFWYLCPIVIAIILSAVTPSVTTIEQRSSFNELDPEYVSCSGIGTSLSTSAYAFSLDGPGSPLPTEVEFISPYATTYLSLPTSCFSFQGLQKIRLAAGFTIKIQLLLPEPSWSDSEPNQINMSCTFTDIFQNALATQSVPIAPSVLNTSSPDHLSSLSIYYRIKGDTNPATRALVTFRNAGILTRTLGTAFATVSGSGYNCIYMVEETALGKYQRVAVFPFLVLGALATFLPWFVDLYTAVRKPRQDASPQPLEMSARSGSQRESTIAV